MEAYSTAPHELEQKLHERAASIMQCSDFGAPSYRRGLRILLQAMAREPVFTPMGREMAYGTILGTLMARLSAQRGLAARGTSLPMIEKPIVITGIPRTGTTALHKLMALDPQFQGLEHWLAETPMTRPLRSTWPDNPAYQASVAGLQAFFAAMPEMRKAHDMVADEVGECLDVLGQSFISNRFGSSIFVPSYDEWFFAQSETESYRHYARIVRLVGAAEPDKRWLLKNPGHITQLRALLEVFPDAMIIHTHRDPLAAIPSLCSTLYMARQIYEGDNTRRDVIGPRECRYWSHALDDAVQVRRHQAGQFIDVDHRLFHRDPWAVIHQIYEWAGLTLSDVARSRMQGWIRAHPSGEHSGHRYDIESWGINEAMLRSSFADYRATHRFDQPR